MEKRKQINLSVYVGVAGKDEHKKEAIEHKAQELNVTVSDMMMEALKQVHPDIKI